jgi:glycosyltransferase involved in cell wall biosynthesis
MPQPKRPSFPQSHLAGGVNISGTRVLFCMHHLALGGAEIFALEMAQALKKQGAQLFLITEKPSDSRWLQRWGHLFEKVYEPTEAQSSRAVKKMLFKILSESNVSCLYIHHHGAAYHLLPEIKKGWPVLRVIDSLHILELPMYQFGYPLLSAYYSNFIDRHHVVSLQLKEYLKAYGVIEQKIVLSYLLRRELPNELTLPPLENEKIRIAFVGRLEKQKAPWSFLKMASILLKQFPNRWTFTIVGDGSFEKFSRRYAKNLGIDSKIKYLGQVEDMQSFYQETDLIVLASENEGIALVIYEALSAGKLILCTDVGGQAEVLPKDCLVDSKQMRVGEALAKRVIEWVQVPKELKIDLREVNSNHFKMDDLARDLLGAEASYSNQNTSCV